MSVAEALIKHHPEMQLDHIDISGSNWAQSLFRRMGFVKRFGTTGKVPIPEALRKELETSYLHDIVRKIEDNNILPSLVLNLDQTPSKYVPVSNKTLAMKGAKTVPIKGSNDKRMITLTFTITLDGKFLPPQIIYGGKTLQSLPRVKFPPTFSLSANPKHYSNEQESIKLLNEIIVPYIKKERGTLGLKKDQPALLIMDVFKGQMTDPVLKVLADNHILLQSVPANFTYLFQPLDVQGGPNGYVKRIMKKKFANWYTDQITQAMDNGQELDTIEVELKLSIVKPLHAKWLIEMYNEMTSADGKQICLKGWKVAGITEAVKKGLSGLESLDPFDDIDPMLQEKPDVSTVNQASLLSASRYICEYEREDESDEEEWVAENEADPSRNIFDVFDDEEDL